MPLTELPLNPQGRSTVTSSKAGASESHDKECGETETTFVDSRSKDNGVDKQKVSEEYGRNRFFERKSSGVAGPADRIMLKRKLFNGADDIDSSSSMMLSSELDHQFYTQQTTQSQHHWGNNMALHQVSSNRSVSDLPSLEALPSTESIYHFGIPSSPPLTQEYNAHGEYDKETEGSTAIPSSPPLFAASQTTIREFERPQMIKQIHPISRNSTLIAENELIRPKRQKLPDWLNPEKVQREEEFAIDRNGKVYGIFLENSKLPDNYKLSLFDDPSFFVVKNNYQAISQASQLITDLFDRETANPVYSLRLDDLGLTSLPEQIVDFKDLVVYGPEGIIKPVLHIHASKNNLRSVTPNLFEIRGLEVLSLRENKIARIPGYIEKATDLKELNLSNNKLKWLPHNILKLDGLEMIRIRPNPLIEVKDVTKKTEIVANDVALGSQLDSSSVKTLRYVGQLHWVNRSQETRYKSMDTFRLARNLTTLQDMMDVTTDSGFKNSNSDETAKESSSTSSSAPKLVEYCLRGISKYPIGRSELLKWKETVSENVYKLTIKALIHGTNGETCGVCNQIVVEPIAEVMEWWDFKDAKLLPIKRKFCSSRCIKIWNADIESIQKSVVGVCEEGSDGDDTNLESDLVDFQG